MSSFPDDIPEIVVPVLEAIQATRYCILCSAFVILYDYVISFDQEVEFIWSKRWSLIKAIFIWHRYFGIFCALFEATVFLSNTVSDPLYVCGTVHQTLFDVVSGYFWVRWEAWGYSSVVLTTEGVLLLWIYVVYNKSIRLLAFASCFLVAEVIAVVAVLAKSFSNFHAKASLIPGVKFCLVVQAPSFYHVFWTPILAYHSIVFVLFLAKGWTVFRGDHKQCMSTGMIERIYKDSLVNFLAIFVAYFSCAVMWLAADPFLAQIPVGFALSLSVTSCNRLLLNIRHAYYTHKDANSDPVLIPPAFRTVSCQDETGSQISLSSDARSVRVPSIYAEHASRDQWIFELREMKWSGKLK